MTIRLPPVVLRTRDRYVAAFPLWSISAGPEAEARARTWTIALAEQLAFDYPGEGYGCKRADGGRPISKDVIARQEALLLFAWDMLSGAGTGTPTLVVNPIAEDITGQIFVSVRPTNHLAGASAPPARPEVELPPYPGDHIGTQFGLVLHADYHRAGQPPNPDMEVWAFRTLYDYLHGGLSMEASLAKHRAEWCAVLGVPVP